MIITILLAVVLAAAIALYHVFIDEMCDAVAIVFGLIAVLCSMVMTLGILLGISHGINYELNLANATEERASIEYRLELQNDYDTSILVNGGVYKDAVEFNAKVRSDNKWGKNPWTNWYHGWAYAGLEEIEMPTKVIKEN